MKFEFLDIYNKETDQGFSVSAEWLEDILDEYGGDHIKFNHIRWWTNEDLEADEI